MVSETNEFKSLVGSKMYEAITRSISVSVELIFLEDQSSPDEDHYVWAYQVKIRNKGLEAVQLLNRHWRITDARGQLQEVKGEGVVGEQPVLNPGEKFEYTSGTPLSTPSGFMEGYYEMENNQGIKFEVYIPQFSLDSPFTSTKLN